MSSQHVTGECFISDTTIPGFQVLCTVRDYFHYPYHCEIKADFKHSYMWVLSKCKNRFNFAMDQSKWPT